MGRLQKNTVKHYLNTRLKPTVFEQEDMPNQEAYPVYLKIRVQQKQTQIKSSYWMFRSNDLDEISNLDRFNSLRNDERFSNLTKTQFESNDGIQIWMERERQYYLRSIDALEKMFNSETLEIKFVTSKLPELTWPIHILISETYKSMLKSRLSNTQHQKLINIIDWHWNSFWDIMAALISIMDGVVFKKKDSESILDIINEFSPIYLIINDLFAVTSKRVIWLMEWQSIMSEYNLIDRLKEETDKGSYSRAHLRNFLSEVNGEISKVTSRILLADYI